MYEGLDAVDWAGMQHAYGPAREVPDLLRGLVDPDPAVREVALDAMYGGVHHQGDVYDCTLAAVPFLLQALTAPGTPGRDGIAELLASIGAADDWPLDADDDEDFAAMVERIGHARQLITAAGPDLLGLAADPDPALRAALQPLLTICAGDPRVAATLAARFAVEADAGVRRALLDGLSRIAARTGDRSIVGQLLTVAATAPEASTAAAALIAVGGVDPALVPLDGAADTLERAYAEDAPPAGYTTDTLIGAVRVLSERANEGRRAPHAARLIDRLTDVLGPRVAERADLLARLLRSPHLDVVDDALFGAAKLVERWRGEHTPLVRLFGAHLTHPEPKVARHAADTLRHWAPLTAAVAGPAAAVLADLDTRPWRDGLPAWAVPSRADAPGLHPTLELLARLGDERALPYLLTALALPARSRDTGHLLARYPQHAERIVAALLPVLPVHRAGTRPPEWYGLHAALQASGAAAAAAVPWLLTRLDDASATTLGRIGAAAAAAVPALRVAATGDDPRLAVAAAEALWRIERADVLPWLTPRIDGPAGTAALRAIAAMGAAAAPAAPYVATFLDARDAGWWRPTAAALALWHVSGDAERAAPVLTAAWHANPRTRLDIAAAATPGTVAPCAGGGPSAGAHPLAAALAPVLRAELAEPRRHGTDGTGWSSMQVTADERLLADCRRALATPEGVQP
ncbi:hypothetical protein AB0H83_19475 [Dactylosporangium sp. NPDC050688]|uniref:hypothetical protein n=1 Tax=Dactylosporangium sp. NPDC050688 TaxID=3157217 RepID=UPI0033C67C01